LQITWPGGKVTTTPVPRAAKEILIDQTGEAQVLNQ
jgi:hypothetical protein